MNVESQAHPWIAWLYVAIIIVIGFSIVYFIVKFLIAWAHKPDVVKTEEIKPVDLPKPHGPESRPDRKP